jgi:hypothetical protein
VYISTLLIAVSKTTPLDGEFEDNTDSEWDSADEDEDFESESECETDKDEEKLKQLKDLASKSQTSDDDSDVLCESMCCRERYEIDSMGNECLPDYVWVKLSKL